MSDTLDLPLCMHCGEPVVDGEPMHAIERVEDGRVIAVERAQHHACAVRAIVGSVGHQRGLCSCHGGPGTMEDPPGMTTREAAEAAYREAILRGALWKRYACDDSHAMREDPAGEFVYAEDVDAMAAVVEVARKIERGCDCEYDHRCRRCGNVIALHTAIAALALGGKS